MIETLGEAKAHGWRVTARSALGKQVGVNRFRECVYHYELDLDTLIWTGGALFPISILVDRLKCPRSGSRKVALLFNIPATPAAQRASDAT